MKFHLNEQPGVPAVLDSVTAHYGKFKALDNVSLDISAGEFVSLLGPSGSGKTTLLMNVAGFEQVTEGQIVVGGRNVTHVPPHKRDFGVVFQRYALFPHMSVADNIEYPLKLRGVSSKERQKMRSDALELVGLGEYSNRKPAQLSGGQQQRVALARVLVYRPPLILFDEPLGALDRGLREQVQLEIRHLNKDLGITMLFVTHDQEEALTMSDRVALMREGRIEQFAPGRSIYYQPDSRFSAEFLGRTNILEGTVNSCTSSYISLTVLGQTLEIPHHLENFPANESTVPLAVRPESFHISHEPGVQSIKAEVIETVFSGPTTAMTVQAQGQRILLQGVSSNPAFIATTGDTVYLDIQPELAAVLPDR